MFRVILALLLMTSQAFAVTQFTVNVPLNAGDLKSNFPAEALAQWSIFQTLLQNYRKGYYVTFNNSTTLNIESGEISVWSGTASLFLQNTSTSTATAANLDIPGAFAPNTTYYVYAGTSSVVASSAAITISLNNTTPAGVTYFQNLGNFKTDSGANIIAGSISQSSTNGKVGTILNYGASASAFTPSFGNLKIAYGTLPSVTTSQIITNLPFTSTSSYSCSASPGDNPDQNVIPIIINSASQITIYVPSNNRPINWTCIGV